MTSAECYLAAHRAYQETFIRVALEARHPKTDCIPDPESEAIRAATKVIDAYVADQGDELARYEGKDGHRDWWSGGAWLYPGDRVVIIPSSSS